eukprot:523805_1
MGYDTLFQLVLVIILYIMWSAVVEKNPLLVLDTVYLKVFVAHIFFLTRIMPKGTVRKKCAECYDTGYNLENWMFVESLEKHYIDANERHGTGERIPKHNIEREIKGYFEDCHGHTIIHKTKSKKQATLSFKKIKKTNKNTLNRSKLNNNQSYTNYSTIHSNAWDDVLTFNANNLTQIPQWIKCNKCSEWRTVPISISIIKRWRSPLNYTCLQSNGEFICKRKSVIPSDETHSSFELLALTVQRCLAYLQKEITPVYIKQLKDVIRVKVKNITIDIIAEPSSYFNKRGKKRKASKPIQIENPPKKIKLDQPTLEEHQKYIFAQQQLNENDDSNELPTDKRLKLLKQIVANKNRQIKQLQKQLQIEQKK